MMVKEKAINQSINQSINQNIAFIFWECL